MTASKVLFDTWAWWEVLQGSPQGTVLRRRYLDAPGVQVPTAAISLGEFAAKLSSEGASDLVPLTIHRVRHASVIVDLTAELAVEAGLLRTRLRKRGKSASLADGIVLATARQNEARLISVYRAFAGEPDASGR